MYGSSKARKCVLCGRRDPSVAKRLVACGDLCRCEEERTACEECALESYEGSGDE